MNAEQHFSKFREKYTIQNNNNNNVNTVPEVVQQPIQTVQNNRNDIRTLSLSTLTNDNNGTIRIKGFNIPKWDEPVEHIICSDKLSERHGNDLNKELIRKYINQFSK